MKRIIKIIAPSILMLLLIYVWRDGKDILNGLYIVFPLMYILQGIICSNLKKELLISLILLSITFLIPINLWFRIGSCIGFVIFYNLLGSISYLISCLIKKKIKK